MKLHLWAIFSIFLLLASHVMADLACNNSVDTFTVLAYDAKQRELPGALVSITFDR